MMFKSVFFVEVNTDGFTMCMVVYSLIVVRESLYPNDKSKLVSITSQPFSQQSWIPFYGVFVLYMSKLFVVCALGTIFELAVSQLSYS